MAFSDTPSLYSSLAPEGSLASLLPLPFTLAETHSQVTSQLNSSLDLRVSSARLLENLSGASLWDDEIVQPFNKAGRENTNFPSLVNTGKGLDSTLFTVDQGAWVSKVEGDRLLSPSTASSNAIVFIDSSITDYQSLIAGVSADTEVVVLNPDEDGVTQISRVLAQRSQLSAVHIVSHGQSGQVQLGSTSLGGETLADYTRTVQSWTTALTDQADLLFYGCDLAAGEAGQAFMQQMSTLTGADVAASMDLTGNEALGGDWILEKTTGTIETGLAFSNQAIASYQGVFADITSYTTPIINGLDQLVIFANAIDTAGQLAQELPLIGENIGDLVNIGDVVQRFRDRVVGYLNDASSVLTSEALANALNGQTITAGGLTINLSTVTADDSNPSEIRLNVQLQATRTTTVPLDFSTVSGDTALSTAGSTANVTGTLDFDFTFGIETAAGVSDRFFIRLANPISTSVAVNTTLNAAMQVGFLDANVNGGTVQLDAQATVNLADPNGDTRIKIPEFDANTATINAPNSSLNIDLPVQAATGLNGLGGVTLNVAIDDNNLFDATAPTVVLSEDLEKFTNIKPDELYGMLGQLNQWFNQLSGTNLLDVEIPFLQNTTIGDAINFGTAFQQDVLQHLVELDANGNFVLDAQGNPNFFFDTAQELAQILTTQLTALSGLPVVANYDPTSNELTFAVQWNRSFTTQTLPVDFNLDLGDDLANISSSTNLNLTANAGLEFTFGLDLDPADGVSVSPLIFQPTLPGASTNFQLASPANFSVKIIEEAPGTNVNTINVSVTTGTQPGRTIADLVLDIQNAINAQLVAAGGGLSNNSVSLLGFPQGRLARGTSGSPSAVLTATNTLPANGQLAQDVSFLLTLDGTTKLVAIAASSTTANTSATDLIADINAALSAAGIARVTAALDGSGRLQFTATGKPTSTPGVLSPATLVVNFASSIVVEYTGDPTAADTDGSSRIALTARPTTRTTTQGTPPQTVTEVITRRLEISADFDDPAYQNLGLLTSPIPYNGQLSSTANFSIVVDGTTYNVAVDAAQTTANTSVDDLIADINAALAAAGVPTDVQATGALTDPDTGKAIGNRIIFKAADSSSISELVLLAADPTNAAVKELGFSPDNPADPNDGAPIASQSRATAFFIDNASFSGNLSLSADDIQAQANFGFLGLDITDSSGSIVSAINLDISDGGNSRIQVDTLLDKLGAGQLTDIVNASVTGSANLTLNATPKIGGISEIDGITDTIDPANLTIAIADFINQPDTIQVNVTGLGADVFESFTDLDFSDVIAGLQKVVDYLKDLDNPTIAGLLNEELPLLNQSVTDLIDLGDRFASFINQLTSNPADSIQQLESRLKDALGLPATSNLVKLSLDLPSDPTGDPTLRIDFNFDTSLDASYAMDLNLAELAGLAGAGGALGGLSNLVGVSTTGDLDAAINAAFKLSLGLELDATDPTPFLFTGATGTRLDLNATVSGQDLDFTAQIGPFGVFVRDGKAGLGGNFTVELVDDGDGRRDFSEGFDSSAVSIDLTGGGTLGGNQAINLPLYFPSESNPLGGVGNNSLILTVPNLEDLLQGDVGSLSITTPDLNDILTLPSPLDILRNPDIVIDGLDTLLMTVQDALDGEIYGVSLPLIGDGLQPAGQFIEDFREDVLSYLSYQFRRGGALNPIDLVRNTLFNVFGRSSTDPDFNPGDQDAAKLFGTFGGLDLLHDLNSDGAITVDDIQLTEESDQIQFDMQLGESYTYAGTPLNFDVGLPSLGLQLDAGLALNVDWTLNFGFGVNLTDGFYFVTDNNVTDGSGTDLGGELVLELSAGLQGTGGAPATVSGVLGFLAVNGTDQDTGLDLTFAIDLKDPNDNGQLTFGELASPATGFDDVLEAKASGSATVDIDLQVGFDTDFNDTGEVSPVLPSLGATLLLNWNFLNASTSDGVNFGSQPTFAFNDVYLDLGSFITDFAAPFLAEIQQVLGPLDWLLDREDGLLYKRLPILSDLAGETINLKKLIELLDPTDRVSPFVNAVAEIYSLVDMVSEAAADAAGNNMRLQFGSLDLSSIDFRNPNNALSKLNASSFNFNGASSTLDNLPDGSAKTFASGFTKSTDGGIAFPILEPATAIKLLLGQTADLVTYDLPRFGFDFNYTQRFPIFPPLFATLRGYFSAGLDLKFGYDTTGVENFLNSDNFLDIIDGFYISDVDDQNVDVPELKLVGGIAAGASLNVGVAEAGVEGGIEVNVDFNLDDPDRDGKVRLDELVTNIILNKDLGPIAPIAVFDISARLDWFFRAYISILFVINEEMNLGRGTLASFEVGPFVRQPMLAERVGDKLQLNIGRNSQNRIHGDTSDGNEVMSVREDGSDFVITFQDAEYGSVEQRISRSGITQIVAYGDNGNDTIDLSQVTSVTATIEGGVGNDTLTGTTQIDTLDGGEGDDIIEGRTGNDLLLGGKGADTLRGQEGDDRLFGAEGADTLEGGANNDTLEGGADADTLRGGLGDDSYVFGSGWGADEPVTDDGGRDIFDFTNTLTDLTVTLQNGKINAASLGNSVENPGFQIEEIRGGRGADTFEIYETGTEEILLNGQAGSDDYIVHFSDPAIAPPPPLNVALKDEGNVWNTDVAIVFGSTNADQITVTDEKVQATFPGGSTQEFKYNKFGADSGIEALEVYALAGADQVSVASTPATTSVIVSGGDDNDTITVGGSTVPGGAVTLNQIDGDPALGLLEISGDNGLDRLVVDDSGDTGSNTGTLTDKQILGLGMTAGLEYTTIERVDLTLGSGSDTLAIASTISGVTTINAGAGTDQVTTSSISGAFILNGGDDADTLDASSVLGLSAFIGGGGGNDTIKGGRNGDLLRGDSTLTLATSAFVLDPAQLTITAAASQGNDRIEGGKGNDLIYGEGGNDDILGGIALTPTATVSDRTDGTDFIYGGAGADVILGDNGQINPITRAIASLDGEQGAADYIFGDTGTLTVALTGGGTTTADLLFNGTTAIVLPDAIGSVVTAANAPSVGEGSDTIRGGVGNDAIAGGGGDDQIGGNAGKDQLVGDYGQITFSAGAVALISTTEFGSGGNDSITGDQDEDLILGGFGNDALDGGDAADLMVGDHGSIAYNEDGNLTTLDRITTTAPTQGGTDSMNGSAGDDIILAGISGDTINGNAGHDILVGDNGRVTFTNGSRAQITTTDPDTGGNDTINGNEDNDIALGGAGADAIAGNTGLDILMGDNGQITYTTGQISRIEAIAFSSGGGDTIQGNENDDIIVGGAAADAITGGTENDIVLGDNGVLDYTLDGNLATLDQINTVQPGIGGADQIQGDQGNDILLGGAENDAIQGNTDQDIILGDNGKVSLSNNQSRRIETTDAGIGGNDTIQSNEGNDIVLGGAASDTVSGDDGQDILLGDNGVLDYGVDPNLATLDVVLSIDPTIGGSDVINSGAGNDIAIGGVDADTIQGNTEADILVGDNGQITYTAGQIRRIETIDPAIGGSDTIQANEGNDIVLGGAANDTISGDENQDILLGDNGVLDYSVDANLATLDTITSIDAAIGGNDVINSGTEDDIAIGGAFSDTITGGTGNDKLLGDNGTVTLSNGVLSRVETINPTIGAGDTIHADQGDDLAWGGAGNDTITGNEGQDVLLGDQGSADYALDGNLNTLDLVTTTDPTIGGSDTISGGQGEDVIFGGTAGDTIDGDGGEDILLGDHGKLEPNLPRRRTVTAIATGADDGGGDDTIRGGAGDDLILGQQGNDSLFGEDGEDDIIGGHNVIGGADGDDFIDGGADADVALGDNGTIHRRLAADGSWERYLKPLDTVIRDVQRFDDVDHIGGNDTILGGAGDDILHGQRGNDSIEGNTGDDELFGELGDDILRGGAGQDVMLGDVGVVVRAYRKNGTPWITPKGSWRKDVVLTDVGSLTDIWALNPSQLNFNRGRIRDLMLASTLLVTGVYSGAGKRRNANGLWSLNLNLISFLPDGNDQMFGDDGDDVMVGQRGGDRLNGGNGDDYMEGNEGNDQMQGDADQDFMVGDNRSNLASYKNRLPQVAHGIHLIENTATNPDATVAIDPFGTIVIPKINVVPNALDSLMPALPIRGLKPLVSQSLRGNGDITFDPLMAIIPDLVNHLDLVSGNDTMDGGSGDDTLIGDHQTSLLSTRTGIETLDTSMTDTLRNFFQTTDSLKDAALKFNQLQTQDGVSLPRELNLGNDQIQGGDGEDTIVGDNDTLTETFMTGLAGVRLNGNQLQQAILDINQTLADVQGVLNRVRAMTNNARQTLANLGPADDPRNGNPRHVVIAGNDQIQGGNDDDQLTGDDLYTWVLKLTNIPAVPARERTTYLLEGVNPAVAATLDRALQQQNQSLAGDLTPLVSPIVAFTQDFALNSSNDTIDSGKGNDFSVGDYTHIATPLLQKKPRTAGQKRDLQLMLKLILQDLDSTVRNFHIADYDSDRNQRDLFNPLIVGNDTMQGSGGKDIMLGDTTTVRLPVLKGKLDFSFNLERGYLDARDQEYNFKHGLPHQYDFIRNRLSNNRLGEDRLNGSSGNDLLFGANAPDRLNAGTGVDYLFGGKQTDRLTGDRRDIKRSTDPSSADIQTLEKPLTKRLKGLLSPLDWEVIREVTDDPL